MKHTLLIILLFLGQPVWADEAPDSAETETGRPEQRKEPAQEEKGSDSVVWPLPFKPSQEIGADSMISFPTDI